MEMAHLALPAEHGIKESGTSSTSYSSAENSMEIGYFASEPGTSSTLSSSLVDNGGGEGVKSVRRFDFFDEDEEADICRICRSTGDADNPLRYPCACSGSIKFVHQDCLLQWLNHSNTWQCEVCKHPFSFSPVYSENAPARLPFQEFIFGIAMKAWHALQFFLRLSFVLSIWLLIIPFITFWIWRLAFVRSFLEAQRLFLSHLSTAIVLTDCLHGFLLSAGIVFIFLAGTSLRDYFRHLWETGGQDADREDEGGRNDVQGARRQAAQADRNIGADGNVEDAGGVRGISGTDQMIRRNAENVAGRLEMDAARPEAHAEQIFDGFDDGDDGAEDVPFDELVGMQGPVFHLVENAFTVLASNTIFLGAVIFVPFSLGRAILDYFPILFSSSGSPVLSTVAPLTGLAVSLVNSSMKNAISAAVNSASDRHDSSYIGQVAEILKVNATASAGSLGKINSTVEAEILKLQTSGTSHLSDVTTLAVGYFFIFSLVIIYLGIFTLIQYSRSKPLIIGRFYGIASILETLPSLFRQSVAAMRHLMTMIKVSFLLVIELGVFPLMCGWCLDVCTMKMFGRTLSHRVEFFSVSPLTSSLVHWVVGIFYMLQISIFVSLIRGVLREGVLYFLRDPADPNYNPFRDLINDPVHKHARRVLLSVAVSGSLIVMLVFLPVKLAMQMAPTIFPLDIFVSDPFTEISVDLLLFQICIPFAIQHFNLRRTLKSILGYWFSAVGWMLGLTDFLLQEPDNNGTNGNANGDQPIVDAARLRGVAEEPVLALEGVNRPRNAVFVDGGRRDGRRVLLEESLESMNSRDIGIAAFQVSGNGQPTDSEKVSFAWRIVLLLLMAWATLLVFNSAMIIVPILLGRSLFNCLPVLPIFHGVKCNDVYAFVIGSYVIWSATAGVRYSLELIQTRRTRVLLMQMWRWCGIILKSSALLSVAIIIIPVLIGLLFELLVIIPMRVPVDESPVFLLYQDWALGIIFLKFWTRLVMLDQMMPLVDGSWRMRLERVREDGFSRLQALWVLREILSPIIMNLLTALCVPYVLSRGLFPILGYPLIVNSAVYRYAWLGCLVFSALYYSAERFYIWVTNLHNSIRDDRYLIGRRLHNFGENLVG